MMMHTNIVVARAVVLLVLGAVVAGCAHYSVGATSDGEAEGREVAVATVATAASSGIDSARLTRLLVDQLRRRGVSGAEWSGRPRDRAAVRCTVAGPDSLVFEGHARAHLRARCEVDVGDRTRRVHGSARQSAALSGRGDLETPRHAALESAAAEAVADAAPRIARALRDDRN